MTQTIEPNALQALQERIDTAADAGALAAAAGALLARLAAVAPPLNETSEITSAISALNDRVTQRAAALVATEMGVDLSRACWLAFGSQARGEQTLITDQDNGLVFAPAGGPRAASHIEPPPEGGFEHEIEGGGEGELEAQRAQWLAFGQRVNDLLALCGYPLCEGRIMAGQPLCCLTRGEWCRRFSHWLAHGDGNDLFAARIYFDLRPLAGHAALAQPLLALLHSRAAALPRFIKQLADIVLCKPVSLGWRGQVVTTPYQGREMFDLKLSGTALFVDAARLWALAHRLPEVGTVPRLRAAAQAMRVPARELQDWIDGFQALQALRLHIQRGRFAIPREAHERTGPLQGAAVAAPLARPDASERAWVPWAELDTLQRESLKHALRAARVVQQRIELDYCR